MIIIGIQFLCDAHVSSGLMLTAAFKISSDCYNDGEHAATVRVFCEKCNEWKEFIFV